MGLDINEDFQAVGADGVASSMIYAMGPLLRGTLWVTTAVPKLRGQAMAIAQTIPQQRSRAAQEFVIEYCI